MRITSKGQVTIPAAIREAAGLLPETDVEVVLDGETVRIVKASSQPTRATPGQEIVRRMRGSASAQPRMTTEEIMALTRGWGEDDPGFR